MREDQRRNFTSKTAAINKAAEQMATLAAEVRKLREEVSRLGDKCESMHYECLDRSIPYE